MIVTRHTSHIDAVCATACIIIAVALCIISPVAAAPSITDCRVHVISVGDVNGMRPDGTADIMVPLNGSISITYVNEIDQMQTMRVNCTKPGQIIEAVVVGRMQTSIVRHAIAPTAEVTPEPVVTPTITPATKEKPVTHRVEVADKVNQDKKPDNGDDKIKPEKVK